MDCADAQQLCRSVAYLIRRQPSPPCIQIGTIAPPSRVLVTGRLNGADVEETVHPLCNPSRQLAAASNAVFTALGG